VFNVPDVSPGLDNQTSRPRIVLLTGLAERLYVRSARAALELARLSTQYPDAGALADRFGLLGPEVHAGLLQGVEVDARSGLPTAAIWRRLWTDAQLAEKSLQVLRPREDLEQRCRERPGSFYEEQLKRRIYYENLVRLDARARMGSLERLEVALRRWVDGDAHLRVIWDGRDPTGVMVRVTALFSQADRAKPRLVSMDGDFAEPTEALEALAASWLGLDAERIFAQIETAEGLSVEQVVRGVIGPFWIAGLKGQPSTGTLVVDPDECVATFSLDMAGVDLAEDRINDPMATVLIEPLAGADLDRCERARRHTGYHIFRDRKFVVSPDLADEVQAYCQQAGTRNIVYAIS